MLLRKLPSLFKLLLVITLSLIGFQFSYAAMYDMPTKGDDVVGQNFIVKANRGDTLLTIGNRYDVGLHEMLEANIQLKLNENSASRPLHSGTQVLVPTQYVLPPYRKGIVINLSELRLYYFTPDGNYVYTFPVGLGRAEWRTPLTSTIVVKKETDPTWHVPQSIHQYVLETSGIDLPDSMPPGPDNPLGRYAMYLGTSGYLIHGTNQPWSIGKYVSSGCIRMHNEDVEVLYQMVNIGTPVHIINYADKAGWHNGELYVESQIPLQLNEPESTLNQMSIEAALNKATEFRPALVNMEKLNQVVAERAGVPQPVGVATDLVKQASLEQ